MIGSDRMGLTDLDQTEGGGCDDIDDEDHETSEMRSRDKNFLFGCKPSAANAVKDSLRRRFGGETSSDDE